MVYRVGYIALKERRVDRVQTNCDSVGGRKVRRRGLLAGFEHDMHRARVRYRTVRKLLSLFLALVLSASDGATLGRNIIRG